MARTKTEGYANVWGALADTAEEAANLNVRAELIQKIAALIHDSGWTQSEAAHRCGVTQPRINDLLRGRISRFSLDALVNAQLHLTDRSMCGWKLRSPVARFESMRSANGAQEKFNTVDHFSRVASRVLSS